MPTPAEMFREIIVRDLTYCPDTGMLCWARTGKGRPNRKGYAGYLNPRTGYFNVHIGGKLRQAHVLIWLLVHGELPDKQIDHINGIRNDNRIVNLRLATPQQNAANQRPRTTRGYKGVIWQESIQKWRARVHVNGKGVWLGSFLSLDEAKVAYDRAAVHYFGEFALTNESLANG
jgi:hypothetical protein